MSAPTKTEVRRSLADLRRSMRFLNEMLSDGDWQNAFRAAQDLVGTACVIEETLAEHPEVAAG